MRGYFACGLATAATSWCLLLILAAFFLPWYSGSECRATPGGPTDCTGATATAVAANGWWIVFLLAAVASVSLLDLLALHRVCASGSSDAATAAWTGIVLLFAFSYLTGFSIGLFVLPTALFLAFSAALTPRPPAASG